MVISLLILRVDINRANINGKKTKAILFTPVNKALSLSVTLDLGGEEIKFVNAGKSLPVIFSSYVTWDDQVDSVLTKFEMFFLYVQLQIYGTN